jgi:glycosyltransferase involved in cell wall biosynthesis
MKRPVCAVVINVPTPYRQPMFEAMAATGMVDLHVIYCAPAHIDPRFDGQSDAYAVHFLGGEYKIMDTRFHHADWGVTRLLSRIKPDAVITTGFIPTFLYAFLWAVAHRVPHLTLTDGTDDSERSLTWLHRWVRRAVFTCSRTFIGASEGSRRLYHAYGIRDARIFLAPLCTENQRFSRLNEPKRYDLIYCGRLVEHKNPLFALDVARALSSLLGRRVSLRVVGKGPLEAEMKARGQTMADAVDLSFAGYLPQTELPAQYGRSRIFLFPTMLDPWGVVGNEACAAGLPCVVSPAAGVAGDLVVDGVNGYVVPLDAQNWAQACARLLQDDALWARFSAASVARVGELTFDAAAQGMLKAVDQAVAG